MIRRRDMVTLLGGAAAWPLAARAQQSGRVRRIGVIMGDFDSAPRIKAFKSAWPALGWVEGHNVHIDYHFAAGNPDSFRSHAAALVAATPEVILVGGTSILAAVRQARNPFQRYLLGFPIPRVLALSPTSADQEATSPVSRISSRRSEANGCKHSRRLRQM